MASPKMRDKRIRGIVRCLGVLALAQLPPACGGRAASEGGAEGGTALANQDAGAPSWIQGAACVPGSGLDYFPEEDSGACLITCSCDTTSHLRCDKNCSLPHPAPPNPECVQGGKCQPGVGC